LKSVVTELSEHKLDLLAVQEAIWDKGGTEPADGYIYFCGSGNKSYEIRRGGFYFFT
jgi:hypothetical protein